MNKFEKLNHEIQTLTDALDWEQYHNPKDLAIALSIEASELLEHFLWIDAANLNDCNLAEIFDEMADIYIYLTHLANYYQVDLNEIGLAKMEKNKKRFLV